MNDDLRFLKESLDDTVFKDMELPKSLKKKIVKKATAPSRFSRYRPKFAYVTSLVLAASLLLILGVSFIPKDTSRGSEPSIREQQVAIIHFQNDIVRLAKNQQLSESAFLSSVKANKPLEQLEMQRSQVIEDGETIIEGLGKIHIPSELSSYQSELNQSLLSLAKAYQQKNTYYKEVDLTTAPSISMYYLPIEQFVQFEESIGKVYEDIGLLRPTFQMLLFFVMD